MGSADLMPRNLDHRVEVRHAGRGRRRSRPELASTFDALLADTASSWELAGDGVWKRVRPKKEDERPRSAQSVLMRRARRRISLARSTLAAVSPTCHRTFTAARHRPPMPDLPCAAVRIGVLDVGSNTTRLLVASVERGDVVPLDKEKVRLSLGEEIERYGVVSDVHVAAAAKAVRKLAAVARKQGIESLDVFVTAPGRQSGNAARARRRADARGGRSGSRPHHGGGGPARLRRRRRHRRRSSCRARSRSATSAEPRPRSRSARPAGCRTGCARSTSAPSG